MDVVGAKVLAGFVFFFLALTFGWMPYFCFRRYFKQRRSGSVEGDENGRPIVVQCLHSLASGVMLATSLLHLLPESLDAVKDAMSSTYDDESMRPDVGNITYQKVTRLQDDQSPPEDHAFPLAECLVALGFLFIYIIDSLIKSCSKTKYKRDYLNTGENNLPKAHQQTSKRLLDSFNSGQAHGQRKAQWRRGDIHKTKPSLQLGWTRPKFSSVTHELDPQDESECQVLTDSDAGEHVALDNDLEVHANSESENPSSAKTSSSVEVHPLAAIKRLEVPKSVKLRSVALVFALCIHGFFDGIMVGLQTSLPVVMSLLLALSIHKSFVSVGLSLTLLASSDKKVSDSTTIIYVLLFASVAPLGLLVSAAFMHRAFNISSGNGVSVMPGCLQSFAVGTFLYVTLTEMTDHGNQSRTPCVVIVRHLSLLIGFGLMTALRASLGST